MSTRMDEEQFEQLREGIERIAGEVSQLSQVCDALCNCLGGINYAITMQTEILQKLAVSIATPMASMQKDIAEIRAGVDEMV